MLLTGVSDCLLLQDGVGRTLELKFSSLVVVSACWTESLCLFSVDVCFGLFELFTALNLLQFNLFAVVAFFF